MNTYNAEHASFDDIVLPVLHKAREQGLSKDECFKMAVLAIKAWLDHHPRGEASESVEVRSNDLIAPSIVKEVLRGEKLAAGKEQKIARMRATRERKEQILADSTFQQIGRTALADGRGKESASLVAWEYLGNHCPDLSDQVRLRTAFALIEQLMKEESA